MTREEALSKAIMTLVYFQVHFCKSKEAVDNTQAIIDTLEQIEQEPKQRMGRWIDKDGISDFMYCSNCGGKKHYSEKWIGCPYCLADMRESYKEESEDKE